MAKEEIKPSPKRKFELLGTAKQDKSWQGVFGRVEQCK
jgi:hypothetical protein